MPTVSVIIVNYNGHALTCECLKTLARQSFHDFEIIVVDNCSHDGSLHLIEAFLKEKRGTQPVHLIPLENNYGFAGGNLRGLAHAEGRFIALLNNDTEPDEMWLEELVKEMLADQTVGICASKLIVHGTDIIDSAGDGFSSILKGFKRGEGADTALFNEKEFVFGACAGGALYRREMFEEIGFLDEDFFLLFEDIDFNFRAQLAGWKVLYVPKAVVQHKVRSSIKTMSDTAIYYAVRNVELVRVKNIPLGILLLYAPQLIAGIFMDFIYFAVKHGKPGLYFSAKADFIKMLPRMLKKRKAIMGRRKVTNNYVRSIITPLLQRSFFNNKLRKLING